MRRRAAQRPLHRGLTTSLYAHTCPPSTLRALCLNSPFFELNAGWITREVLASAVGLLAKTRPYGEFPGGLSDLYGKSVHHEHHGQWEFDTAWKPLEGFAVRVGWLQAVRQAQRELQAGLDIGVPVLVMHSARSVGGSEFTEAHLRADTVVDVADIRRHAPALGSHVTLVAIDGGMHDLVLSSPEPREQAYAELFRWLTAYGP